jgi:hypothetical protein
MRRDEASFDPTGKERKMEQEGTQGAMICEKCGASFDTKEELDRHVQETHPDEGMQEEPQRQGS